MEMRLSALLDLDEPCVDAGFVTRFDIEIVTEKDEAPFESVARATATLIHLGTMMEYGEHAWQVLDADSFLPEQLYPVYFNEGRLRDQFTEGGGSDLMYIDGITVEPRWADRGIEFALVRRLCDTIGGGCELAIVPYDSEHQRHFWERAGFASSSPDETRGFMHAKLALLIPRVISNVDGPGYRVVPNPGAEPERLN